MRDKIPATGQGTKPNAAHAWGSKPQATAGRAPGAAVPAKPAEVVRPHNAPAWQHQTKLQPTSVKPTYSSMTRQHTQAPPNTDSFFPTLGGKKSEHAEFPSLGTDRAPGHFAHEGQGARPDLEAPAHGNRKAHSMMTDTDYGLEGLMNIIRNPTSDIATLFLGIDLASLGLDLASGEPLHVSFVSPWGDTNKRMDQLFPPCYQLMHDPQSIHQRFGQFQDDTLFYLFYNAGMTQYTEIVTKELCRRGWRWYPEWSVWVHPSLLGASKETPSSCVTFDPVRWEHVKRELPMSAITHGEGLFVIE